MKTLLIHGLGQTPASWNETAALLEQNVLCPDLKQLLSAGKSDYNALYTSFEQYCTALDAPLQLCGLSLGAVLALQYGIEHPEKVRALALIAPQFAMPKHLLRAQNAVFHLMPGAAFAGTGLAKGDMISLCRSMMDIDLTSALPQMQCRTLILCGAQDKANKLAAYRLHALLPNAELSILPDAGHEINREAPAALARKLNKFFR